VGKAYAGSSPLLYVNPAGNAAIALQCIGYPLLPRDAKVQLRARASTSACIYSIAYRTSGRPSTISLPGCMHPPMLPCWPQTISSIRTVRVRWYSLGFALMPWVQGHGQTVGIHQRRNRVILHCHCHAFSCPCDPHPSWRSGPRAEDGLWAPLWYKQVHQSSGF